MLNGKRILLTGGTGSFGQKFTEIILAEYDIDKLIIYSRDELKQAQMRQRFSDPRLRFVIGDVRRLQPLLYAMQDALPDIVIHAAAMKRIEACEANPLEAIDTNILGARNVAWASRIAGVERLVTLGSDKGCVPVNLYGATKLAAEKLVLASNSARMRCTAVRYGNVLGSRGSVVHTFREQAQSGILTITDVRMTRFWLTLVQAVRFVLQTVLPAMRGGEVFVPKLPSMKVIDLAKAVVPGCQHRIVGIGHGEKLHEMLIAPDEARMVLDCGAYYKILTALPHAEIAMITLPDGWSYRSDTNDWWLSGGGVLAMLGECDQ